MQEIDNKALSQASHYMRHLDPRMQPKIMQMSYANSLTVAQAIEQAEKGWDIECNDGNATASLMLEFKVDLETLRKRIRNQRYRETFFQRFSIRRFKRMMKKDKLSGDSYTIRKYDLEAKRCEYISNLKWKAGMKLAEQNNMVVVSFKKAQMSAWDTYTGEVVIKRQKHKHEVETDPNILIGTTCVALFGVPYFPIKTYGSSGRH